MIRPAAGLQSTTPDKGRSRNAMPSTLSWLDHDSGARERMDRVLALFEERGTMDELGLGMIRDAYSETEAAGQ